MYGNLDYETSIRHNQAGPGRAPIRKWNELQLLRAAAMHQV